MTDKTIPTPDVTLILVLPSDHEIRIDLLRIVEARIPELDRNTEYTLKAMAGQAFWRTVPRYDRIQGGITFAYLVKTGQLPLEFATCPHAVPKKYRPI
mgnify:CR=1 FL=1